MGVFFLVRGPSKGWFFFGFSSKTTQKGHPQTRHTHMKPGLKFVYGKTFGNGPITSSLSKRRLWLGKTSRAYWSRPGTLECEAVRSDAFSGCVFSLGLLNPAGSQSLGWVGRTLT